MSDLVYFILFYVFFFYILGVLLVLFLARIYNISECCFDILSRSFSILYMLSDLSLFVLRPLVCFK